GTTKEEAPVDHYCLRGHKKCGSILAKLRFYTENRRRPADDFLHHRGSIEAGCTSSALARLRLVDKGQHCVLRIVHREGRDEDVEVLVVRITAVDDLLGRAGLAADVEAVHQGAPAGTVI